MFLYKNSNGYYYLYFSEKGKRKKISTHQKYKANAVKFITEFRSAKDDPEEATPQDSCLYGFLESFLKYSCAVHTQKTTKAFRNTFESIKRYFPDQRLSSLTTEKFSKYFTHRIETSSIYMARKDRINLSSVFSKAVLDNKIYQNPIAKIKPFKIPAKMPLFLSYAEYTALLSVVDIKLLFDIIIFAINTGLRQMEIITLKWDQINLEKKFLLLDNINHINKSKRVRGIPLNEPVMQMLQSRKGNSFNNLVFTLNNRPPSPSWITGKFKRYVLKAKLNPKFHFHSLRHSFASLLVQAGVGIFEVKELLGHQDLKTTMIYAHLAPDNLKDAVNMLPK